MVLALLSSFLPSGIFAAVPSPPDNLKAVPGSTNRIDLHWADTSSDETEFWIERSADGSSGWRLIGTPAANATDYSDSGFATKTRYYYRISAINASGQSSLSATTWAYTVYTGKPLTDWVDVKKTNCGGIGQRPCADGDGTPDTNSDGTNEDTAGIQGAIDEIGLATFGTATPAVLWFPNGTYTIDRTLYMHAQRGIQFVGESQSGVVLRWTGSDGTYTPDIDSDGTPEEDDDYSFRRIIHSNGNPGTTSAGVRLETSTSFGDDSRTTRSRTSTTGTRASSRFATPGRPEVQDEELEPRL